MLIGRRGAVRMHVSMASTISFVAAVGKPWSSEIVSIAVGGTNKRPWSMIGWRPVRIRKFFSMFVGW